MKKIICLICLLIIVVSTGIASDTLNVLLNVSVGGGAFAGSVKNLNGGLIPDANVTVVGTNFATITPTGNYNIDLVPSGSYSLRASADGHLSQTRTNQLIEAGITTTVDFALSPTGRIRGNVLDFFTSNGINNVNVTLIQFGEVLSSTLTDATGYYEFNNLAPGYYDLNFEAVGYTANSKTHNQVLGGQNTTVNLWLW